jgi:hypothetical protein
MVIAEPTYDYRITCGHDQWADEDADKPNAQDTANHADEDDPERDAGTTPH